jgi:hypothetical protein
VGGFGEKSEHFRPSFELAPSSLCSSLRLKAKERKKCRHRDDYDDDLFEFCRLHICAVILEHASLFF